MNMVSIDPDKRSGIAPLFADYLSHRAKIGPTIIRNVDYSYLRGMACVDISSPWSAS